MTAGAGAAFAPAAAAAGFPGFVGMTAGRDDDGQQKKQQKNIPDIHGISSLYLQSEQHTEKADSQGGEPGQGTLAQNDGQ